MNGNEKVGRMDEPELICDCCGKPTTVANSVPVITTDWRSTGAICLPCTEGPTVE